MKLLCDTFLGRLVAALTLYAAMAALWIHSSAPLPTASKLPPCPQAAARVHAH